MDFELVAASIRASYREVTPRYRKDDEIEVTTDNHARLSEILREISFSFPHPISILDAGCGTGRYFHCLENVSQLVGIDVSPDMLLAAESPVREEWISAADIQLICENIFAATFPSESFEFIYSLGMFGHGCPVTVEICNRFHDWLKPGGRLFFNLVHLTTLPLRNRIRRRLRPWIYPLLPRSARNALDRRRECLPFFGMTSRELTRLMARTNFADFAISSHVCRSPLWKGSLLECSATRQAGVEKMFNPAGVGAG
jgi:SAM-dependent methyltransferase